jgi:hypothetical protein
MADQKISQLSSIGAVDNAADLFPIVDTSASETKKITPSALKTALALNNVDNTSDANKPVSTATQTALDGKQSALGFTAENVANKSTSVVTDQASSTKYPTVKAVYDWAVATFQAAIGYTPANKAGETFTGPISATNLSGTNTGDNAVNSLYSGLEASKEDVANKSTSVTTDQASNTKYPSVKAVYDWAVGAFQASLGYTAENVANKSTSVTTDQASNTKYPSVKAVYDWAVGLFATIANLALKTDKLVVANRQTASYTLVLSDADKLVEMNVGSANNLTVPLNSSVAFSTGTQILLAQYGAGQTTIVATSGVTIRSNGAKLKLNAQYSGATLVKIGENEWYLFGDIA